MSSSSKAEDAMKDKLRIIVFLGERFPGSKGAASLIDESSQPRRVPGSFDKPQVHTNFNRNLRLRVLAAGDWDHRLLIQLEHGVMGSPEKTAMEWRVAISKAVHTRHADPLEHHHDFATARRNKEVLPIDVLKAAKAFEDEAKRNLPESETRNDSKNSNRNPGRGKVIESRAGDPPPTADEFEPMVVDA